MDSRKWTAIDFLNNAKKKCELIDGYSIIYDIDKALALLTAEPEPDNDKISPVEQAYNNGFLDGQQAAQQDAEPEPCEDAREAAEASFDSYKDDHRDYSDICPKYGQGDTALRAAAYIDGYVAASQVADKQAEEDQAANEAIASICFAAGVETPDGTSVGAVRNLAKRAEEMRAQMNTLREAAKEIRSHIDYDQWPNECDAVDEALAATDPKP